MLLDMSEIFNEPLFTQQVPLMRRIVMTDQDGDLNNEYVLPVNITAIIHPTGPDDIQRLEEGERYFPSKKIFAKDPINIGDIFIYQEKRWRIVNLSNWNEYGFYDGIGILYQGTESNFAQGFELK